MNYIRCGYCRAQDKTAKGGRLTFLIPVIVTSRGDTYRTHAHPNCYIKWRRIAEVIMVSGTPEEKVMLERFAKYKQSKLRWYQKYKKKCDTCGYEIDPRSKKCLTCNNRETIKTRKQRYDAVTKENSGYPTHD